MRYLLATVYKYSQNIFLKFPHPLHNELKFKLKKVKLENLNPEIHC